MNKKNPMFAEKVQSLPIGVYKHYKGHLYQVIYIAFHSETLEALVVYKSLEGNQEIWVRPLAMFCEKVTIEGDQEVPRFRYMGKWDGDQQIVNNS